MAEKKANGDGKKKIIIFGLIGLLLVGAIGTSVWYFLLRENDKSTVIRKVDEDFYKLGEFTVNLADEKRSVFIRADIVLGYEKNEESVKELDKYKSKIRDAINMLLITKTEDDVKDAFGLEQLKRQIKIRVDSILDEVVITDVLFNTIAIQ